MQSDHRDSRLRMTRFRRLGTDSRGSFGGSDTENVARPVAESYPEARATTSRRMPVSCRQYFVLRRLGIVGSWGSTIGTCKPKRPGGRSNRPPAERHEIRRDSGANEI